MVTSFENKHISGTPFSCIHIVKSVKYRIWRTHLFKWLLHGNSNSTKNCFHTIYLTVSL